VQVNAAPTSASPHAAAVLLDLLRVIEGLPVAQALVAESLAYGLLQGSAEHARWLAERAPTPSQPLGRVLVERAGNALAILLDRPAAHNAIDRTMRDALREAFELAALDPEIERVTLSGEGKAYCVGAELSEFGTTRDPATAHAIRMATLPTFAIADCADKLEVHVQGACVGAGLEMAAFAHRITATPSAWFQLPELAMGLIPGAGGCVSISRRIGIERTLELVLSGKRISAQTALDWGLIDAIAD
jgi:enoyl-CoA hydratase/carnithine racemase